MGNVNQSHDSLAIILGLVVPDRPIVYSYDVGGLTYDRPQD